MRIRFLALTALLLASLGLTAWAHVAVMGQREAVTLEETLLEGTAAGAAGVTVTVRTECLDQLFWETVYTAGTEGGGRTGYTYSANRRRYEGRRDPGGIRFDYWGDSGPTREGEAEDEYGMQKPFNDVLSRCPAGTEDYVERVDLRDYYEEFPIYVQRADFFPSGTGIYYDGGREDFVDRQVQRELRRCFPIPVPRGTYVEIRVDKDEEGRSRGYGISFPEDVDWPEVYSAVTEEGCYFTLSSPRGSGGVRIGEEGAAPTAREGAGRLDASRFPLGYGLYYLPVDRETVEQEGGDRPAAVKSVRVGAVRRVLPIDPGTDYAALYPSADRARLCLLAQQGGQAVLTVVDAAAGGVVDALPLFPAGEGGAALADLIVREGFLVACLSDGRFAVVTWAGEDYGVALAGSFANLYRSGCTLSEDGWQYEGLPAVDFDGERLAVADLREGNSFFLALYGREGPQFLALYDNSQDIDVRRGVEPQEPTPLTVALPGGKMVVQPAF